MNLLESFFVFVGVILITSSCEEPRLKDENALQEETWHLTFDGISFPDTMTFSLKDYSLESIFIEIDAEFSKPRASETGRNSSDEVGFYDGVELIISDESVTIIQLEEEIPLPSPNTDQSDDEKCGVAEGDGWKYYGQCFLESCVKNKLEEAAEDLGELGPGECLDLRVRRDGNAKVCGRKIQC